MPFLTTTSDRMSCHLCDGSCWAGRLDPLVTPDLAWLWTQLAEAADRRGDRSLTAGTASVTLPDAVAERAAATGLLGRRHLVAGRRARVNLVRLSERIAPLTPGAVAAHATGRRLAQRAEMVQSRHDREARLRQQLAELLPEAAGEDAWASLRKGGWLGRLVTVDDEHLVERAARVIGLLPAGGAQPVDRRVLSQVATADPHALDRGRVLPGLVLALLAVVGRLEPGTPPREAWTQLGVRSDDIVGGLTVVGIAPVGWTIPDRTPVTLPPRVLATSAWPAGCAPVFVTENPSVLSAAASTGAAIVCTTGTPSAVEVAAIGGLAEVGWKVRVRADFDVAGVNHVSTILASVRGARPWRMSADDYLDGLGRSDYTVALRLDRLAATPWDPELARSMTNSGSAVYEEALLDHLLKDISSSVAEEHQSP
jgi:uncharacterized protein (TIGR02679 family)